MLALQVRLVERMSSSTNGLSTQQPQVWLKVLKVSQPHLDGETGAKFMGSLGTLLFEQLQTNEVLLTLTVEETVTFSMTGARVVLIGLGVVKFWKFLGFCQAGGFLKQF